MPRTAGRRCWTAAQELFAERGFERSTIRDIGERAGLDPTLIARYFGNKAALYLATLRTDFAAEGPGRCWTCWRRSRMIELLERVRTKSGPGPIFDAALRQHPEPAVDAEASAMLAERIVEPADRADSPTGDTAQATPAGGDHRRRLHRCRGGQVPRRASGPRGCDAGAGGRAAGGFAGSARDATDPLTSPWIDRATPADQRTGAATQCPRRDSNPHWNHFKWPASADWATGASLGTADGTVRVGDRRPRDSRGRDQPVTRCRSPHRLRR